MSVVLDEIKKLRRKCRKLEKANRELRKTLINLEKEHIPDLCGMCNPSFKNGR